MSEPAPAPALLELLDRVGLDRGGVDELFVTARDRMLAEVAAVCSNTDVAVPAIDFTDIRRGSVSEADLAAIRRRGCVVVRSTFDRTTAETWDADIDAYLEVNRFEDRYRQRYPDADVQSKIWGIYWSRAQVEARQHPDMTTTRRFLNGLWQSSSEGVRWFDPDSDIGYPDRLRRRPPGVAARGLPPHSDAVSSGGWRTEENHQVFRHVLAGRFDDYDPWDAAYRTGPLGESAAPSAVFRTFQGWTALSDMQPDDGVLHLIPIPTAAAYMVVRGIAGELGLFGDGGPIAAPRRFRADDLLLDAMVPIPTVAPGDTVWWHQDIIHSVAPAANDTRWGNVLYIGAAPSCPRNDEYQTSMAHRFESGLSPIDFPDEHFEADFAGRARRSDLNATGRQFFGIETDDQPRDFVPS